MSCGGSSDKQPTVGFTPTDIVTRPVPTQPASSAGADKPTPAPTTPAGVPTPLSSGPVTDAEAVSVQTADGLVIKGNLFSAPGPRRRILVLASALPDTEASWQDFARELAGQGIATLTLQMPQYKDQGSTRDLALMATDIGTVVSFAESREYPLVYVLGDKNAGVGALSLAAKHKVAGVIAVSSPVSVAVPGNSLDPRADLAKLTVPKLYIASNDESTSAAANTLATASADPKQVKLLNSSVPGAGSGLLRGPDAAAFKQAIKDFVLK
jgi:pimeloyl-ACP methyl ester carboxylesterase